MEDFLKKESIKKQLENRGITQEDILGQLAQFERGSIFVDLIKPAKIDDGIIGLSSSDIKEYISLYSKSLPELNVVKFVPASGAASRMFRELVSEHSAFNNEDHPALENYEFSRKLIENLPKLAFYDDLKAVCDSDEFSEVIEMLLFTGGLNYSNLPKGLIKFHKYDQSSRTAFEEHLAEANCYIKGKDGSCKIHFTVPVEAKSTIERYLSSVARNYEDENTYYDLSYSVQDPSTDTIAVDMENKPYIGNSGELSFRPAGHGALIHNLNSIEADMIFIKNIDNVTVENYLEETVNFKKLLGGYLFFIKDRIHNFLDMLDSGKPGGEELSDLEEFVKKYLFIDFNQALDRDKKLLLYKEQLDRPIRVCGVVKNEGEPGGGPFWIKYGSSGKSLQIVESAQVNMDDADQAKIWNSSTHFNPVDIVCWVNDYRGKKFDLYNYIDREAGLITKKSVEGVEIKALELPGLWNGAMAGWLTVFVEVPLTTFNPVKTVFDLLRKEHQG